MFGFLMKMQHFWFWVIMLVLVNGWLCSGCWEQERIALLRLKANINSPYDRCSLPSWVNSKTADCCAWPEVKCNTTTKRVIQLSLSLDGVTKWIPGDWYFNASLFLPFEELRALHLPDNYCVGWVENEGFDRLSRLKNLEVLNLTGNCFDTTILSTLSGLSSLKSLCLGGNWMHGRSPDFNGFERLSKLSNLEVLDLSDNFLNGSVLSFLNINDFINLKKLDLSYNQFESFEPINHGRQRGLSNLEHLDLSWNNFTNSILSSLNDLSSLKFLSLQSNQLKGPIPVKGLDILSNLKELDIRFNEVENFTFSQELRNLSNIEKLFLDGSSLNGNFLQSIGKMTSLKVLSLSSCNLNDTLSIQGCCELKNLQELYLDGNNLHDKLPSCLGKLKSLRAIDLSDNQFTDNIASSPLSNITSLEYLSLSNNHFQIPVSFKSFANHSNLKFILADSNKAQVEPEFHTFVPRFQVEIFSLSNCTCHGMLPNFLYYQYELRILNLSKNKFGGWLPIWLLDNNTRLEGLWLRDNDFTGPFKLPSYLNPSIRTIDMSVNKIEGEIPANISAIFPKLSAFYMSNNYLGGNLPSCFGDMKSLKELDLSNNNLSGEVPNLFASPSSSLSFLRLSNNKLQGKISQGSISSSSLKFLYLDGNNFTRIPDLFGLDLEILDISNNNLFGKLPKWVGNMLTLSEIALSKNHLEGPIPEDFCKPSWLTLLDLSENNLTGSIPFCLNQPYITHVYLQKNNLDGALPAILPNISSLVILDLGDNNFTGNIPRWIGNFSQLSALVLKGNHFGGRIPTEVCQLQKLSLLDLSRNHLFGPIPRCLGNITLGVFEQKSIKIRYEWQSSPRLSVYSYLLSTKFPRICCHSLEEVVVDNDIYRQLPNVQVQVGFTTKWISYFYKGIVLNYMSGIDLSCNQLTNEIPIELGNLSSIHVLNLSHNNLTGGIPETFSNLRQVESLDLSYNSLQGRIPTQLIELNFLVVFSVAQNNLSGSTPDQKAQFATFNESSYEGNHFLCGPPLHINCTKTKSPPTSPSASGCEIKKKGFMDTESFYVSFLVSYGVVLMGIATVLFMNPYWRKAWFHFIEKQRKAHNTYR